MDAPPPAGLPQASFAPPPQHLEYARYPNVRGQRQHEAGFPTHLDPSLQAIDPNEAFPHHFDPQQLSNVQYGQQYGLPPQLYATPTTPLQQQPLQDQSHRVQELPSHSGPPRQDQVKSQGHGQFGILATPNHLDGSPSFAPNDSVQRLRQEHGIATGLGQGHGDLGQNANPQTPPPKQGGHFPGMRQVVDPPHLDAWRQKLFDVDEPITLTEEE